MVTPVLPELSWHEGMTDEMHEAIARRTVKALNGLLDAPPSRTLLYVAAPNPGAWEPAEAKLLAAAAIEGRGGLAVVSRPQRPNAYGTTDAALFSALLPMIIDLGPPEVNLLVVAARPPPEELGAAVTAMIEDSSAMPYRYAGIHFDSGDALALIKPVGACLPLGVIIS